MKKVVVFLICAFLLVGCKKESAQQASVVEKRVVPSFSHLEMDKVFPEKQLSDKELDSIKGLVQHYYQSVWENENLWGSFLIAKGNQIIYENYRGFSRENHQDSIVATTPLHIASVSKIITAMAILKLVENNALRLTDTVDEILPTFPYSGITIQSLLSQRSGLPKYEHFTAHIPQDSPELQKQFLTNDDLLNMLAKHRPPMARETNKGFMYNNLNFVLLALIIEKVTGLSYPQAMGAMVFEPLQMKNTFVFEEKHLGKVAQTFYQRGEKLHPLDRFDLIYGDKNIYTTPRDLFRFSVAMYDASFLRKDIMEKVFQPYSNEKPGVNNYGLGFRMKIFDDRTKMTYHNGWWHGTNSVFVHQLDSKVTVIAIGNKYSKRVYSAMMLAGLFEPLPFDMPFGGVADTLETAQLKESDSILIANPE